MHPDEHADVAREILWGDGYHLLEDWLDPAPLLKEANESLERHWEENGRDSLFSGGYRPLEITPLALEAMVDPDVLEIAREAIGDEPAFGSSGLNAVPRGSFGMSAHLDYPYFAMTSLPGKPFPALCVQIVVYLVDVRERNAPTLVMPGTQRRPRPPNRTRWRNNHVPVTARAGSVLLSHGAMWHAVGPNETDDLRVALLGSYVPFWVQPMLSASAFPFASRAVQRLARGNMAERIGRGYSRMVKE